MHGAAERAGGRRPRGSVAAGRSQAACRPPLGDLLRSRHRRDMSRAPCGRRYHGLGPPLRSQQTPADEGAGGGRVSAVGRVDCRPWGGTLASRRQRAGFLHPEPPTHPVRLCQLGRRSWRDLGCGAVAAGRRVEWVGRGQAEHHCGTEQCLRPAPPGPCPRPRPARCPPLLPASPHLSSSSALRFAKSVSCGRRGGSMRRAASADQSKSCACVRRVRAQE